MRKAAAIVSKAHGQSGFTLIELMVSLGVMALILGGLAAGLRTIVDGWDRHGNRMADQDMFLRGAGLLRQDIASLQRISWNADGGASFALSGQSDTETASGSERGTVEKPRFIFLGASDRLQFVAIAPPFPTRPGPYVLSYAASGSLTRSRARFHPDMQSLGEIEFKDEVPLIEGPFRFQFSYGDRASSKEGAVGTWRWFPAWPYTDRLPGLIKLEIRNIRTGAHAMPPMIARPRLDAEQACAVRRKGGAGCTIRLDRSGAAGRANAGGQETDRNERVR
ncbi:MAG: prepilin-type N-terminal cleavage/methylation domain-containing protein [Methyloligellaceae bacterium]